MRERRTGDSFWTRRSWRPVKRTYFLRGVASQKKKKELVTEKKRREGITKC
jgi:hypothetical protein